MEEQKKKRVCLKLSKDLTTKQARLVKIIARGECKDNTDAAIKAGYSKKTATVQVSETLRKPTVREELRKAIEKLRPQEKFVDNWGKMIDLELDPNKEPDRYRENANIVLKAQEQIAKFHGNLMAPVVQKHAHLNANVLDFLPKGDSVGNEPIEGEIVDEEVDES